MARGFNSLVRSEQTHNKACASYVRICYCPQLLQAIYGTVN